MDELLNQDEIYVLALEGEAPSEFRGDPFRKWPEGGGKPRPTAIKVSQLAGNVRLFMQQMEALLADTPTQIKNFEFVEFEVSAGVTASGQLALLGVAGAEAGVEGGLKFVFKRRAAQS